MAEPQMLARKEVSGIAVRQLWHLALLEKTALGLRAALAGGLAALALLTFACQANASVAIESFSTTSSDQSAGGHPDLSTSFDLAEAGVEEAARNVTFESPAGVFGNPYAISHCTSSDFALDRCPSGSQAGLITVYANHEGDLHRLMGVAPLFNMDPHGDQTALFAFIVPTLNIPINIPVNVRTATDYGLRFTVQEISQTTPLAGADLIFWGFPADDVHDLERFPKGAPGEPANCPGISSTSCLVAPTPSSEPIHPLTDNPTTCSGSLEATLVVESYQDPDNRSIGHSQYPAVTDCELEVFNPVLFARPTTTETDSASGLDIELRAPQFLGLANAPAQIRSALLTMAPNFTINPDAADGQTACSEDSAHFDTEGPAACPDQSKIGTFRIGTQALPGPLVGSVYIGQPKPGNQYRLFLVANGFGIHAKLVGSFHPDPKTGQLTARFEDLPQAPFESFQMHLFASDRGLMATPTHCTIYRTNAHFFSWNDAIPDQTSSQIFSMDSGPRGSACPAQIRPFNPRLVAGTSDPSAGVFSDFHLKLDRDDGDQFLGDLNFKMPPGFTGDLSGIPYCPEAAIAAAAQKQGKAEQAGPSCPAASQIGTTNVAAGPGSHPFHAVGKMYLAGPLKGAPLSLAAITPALAGPYDYGTVVIRVALHVDPITAQVYAASDTMPQIIGGIPIRMRSIRVSIDKPNFTINPTNCEALSVDSQGIGDQGTVTDFSSYFQAVNCATLPFKPKMKVTQIDRKRSKTKRNQNPRLRFELFTREGDANIKDVAVTLPKAFAIDQRHLGNLCSKAQLAAERCAGRQPIGYVETRTPLLDEPLKGPAYAVSGYGVLPHLAFILDGQVMLIPQAESESVKGGRLRTTVPTVPDAPIGYFRLDLLGGKQGYLINTKDLCRGKNLIAVAYSAQNGKTLRQRVKPKAPCGVGRRAKRATHSRR